MRKNSTNYTDSVICRKCYHPKQKKMYKNPALFHLTEPLSKDTTARCSGILKHIHGSINFHFFFLQVQPVYVKFFSLNRQPSEFCVKDNLSFASKFTTSVTPVKLPLFRFCRIRLCCPVLFDCPLSSIQAPSC